MRVELTSAGDGAGPPDGLVDDGFGSGAGRGADHRTAEGEDVPDGFGSVEPVGRRRPAPSATVDEETLTSVLRPLSPILQDVHDAVLAGAHPPQELNVSFGVQIGTDLKLGIVGISGASSFTVSATWRFAGEA